MPADLKVRVVPVPAEVHSALRRNNVSMAYGSNCEVVLRDGTDLTCLICSDPSPGNGSRQAVVVLFGGQRIERQQFLKVLNDTTKRSGLDIARTSLNRDPGSTVLLVSWSFRGEFRALVATAMSIYDPSAGWQGEEGPGIPDLQDDSGLDSIPEGSSLLNSLGDDLEVPSRRVATRSSAALDLASLRKSLQAFVQMHETTWTKMRMSMLRKSRCRAWELPLGCLVQETVNANGVFWSIHFSSIEDLERACVIAEARIRSGKTGLLRASQQEAADALETLLPELRIVAEENSVQVRMEMARLLNSLLKSLDRLSFESPASISMLDVLN